MARLANTLSDAHTGAEAKRCVSMCSAKDMTNFCYICDHLETAPFLGDNARAVVTKQRRHKSTEFRAAWRHLSAVLAL